MAFKYTDAELQANTDAERNMDSSTGFWDIFNAASDVGKSYFASESAKDVAKGNQKAALANATLSTNAQKALLIGVLVVVGLVVVALIFRGRR